MTGTGRVCLPVFQTWIYGAVILTQYAFHLFVVNLSSPTEFTEFRSFFCIYPGSVGDLPVNGHPLGNNGFPKPNPFLVKCLIDHRSDACCFFGVFFFAVKLRLSMGFIDLHFETIVGNICFE